MSVVVLLLAVLLGLASLVPFVRREAWWIRVFDFPRAQIFALSLLNMGVLFLLDDLHTWQGAVALMASASAFVIQAFRIYPYTPWAPQEVMTATEPAPDATISLLIANVLMQNRSDRRLLAIVGDADPDLILLLETDHWWDERMRVLAVDYPFAVREPLDNEYGMILYSRLPLVDPQITHLVRDGVPSIHGMVRLRSGATVWLDAVHPEPPSPSQASTSLPRDAELLIVGRQAKSRGVPTIIAGDLNDVAWSYTTRLFQKISGLLDPRRGRGMFNTFNAKIPFMRWPLDHVFHSEHFLLAELRRLAPFGSDHFPVLVRLVLQPGAEVAQSAPEADDSDRQAAVAKVRKVEQSDES